MRLFLLIGLLLFLSQPATAQGVAQLPLDNQLPVLDGKASFSFPAQAKDISLTIKSLGGARPASEQTTIAVDIDSMHVEFFVANRHMIAGEGFVAQEIEFARQWKDSLRVLIDQDSLLAILITPTQFKPKEKQNLIQQLKVRTPDRSVFQVNVIANRAAFARKAEWVQLSERVFRTLRASAGDIALTSRKETHPLKDADKVLVFDLPAGFYVTENKGMGFQSFTIRAYAEAESDTWQEVILYVGSTPDVRYLRNRLTEKDGIPSDGKLLGDPIQWRLYDFHKGYLAREKVVPFYHVVPGAELQVVIFSRERATVDMLTQVVERIQLLDR